MEKEPVNTELDSKDKTWFEALDEEVVVKLNRSLKQAENGEFVSNEDMKTKYAAWL